MNILNGVKLNNVEFLEKDGILFGRLHNNGVSVDYRVDDVSYEGPLEAVLMDLDGTTVESEEFGVFIIEETMKRFLGNQKFSLDASDVPFVSGFTTVDHLNYCINKYCPGKDVNPCLEIYHDVAGTELQKIMNGGGKADGFQPAEGLKEFLLELKARNVKIGLATSGLDYKAIPEIVAVFRRLGMGNPLTFYDSIITGGRRKDVGEYGTLGEIVSKPHPWIYTELAYTGLKVQNPSRVLGIEDSAAGAMALRFAGFPVIGLENGNITQSGLNDLCWKKVLRLEEILKLI